MPRFRPFPLAALCLGARLLTAAEPPAFPSGPVVNLASDQRRVAALNEAMDGMAVEMTELQLGVRLVQRGHYSGDEHDAIEKLLFRFLGCRDSLWDVVERYRNHETLFPGDPDLQARAFLTAYHAALSLADHTSLMVATFLEEERAVRKLNEAYPRSGIPAGTYQRLFGSLTKVEHLEALKAAWELFRQELQDETSALSRALAADPAGRALRLDLARRQRDADLRTEYILMKSSVLLPEVRNRLRHTRVAELAGKARAGAGSGVGAVKGFLFTNVSRLRGLAPVNLEFHPEDLAILKERLQPGDVLLTFSDGYMSNLFLPGKFKHGLTYVGSPAQRRAAGLPAGAGGQWPEAKRAKLATDLELATLPDGSDADLIEAVAEGVIFNSLRAVTHNHIARLLVLRPRLTPPQRAASLASTFLLLGTAYDFDFDFVDGSHQCCTEVIYRALHKAGPISFDLVPRAGVLTLAADDIIQYHLKASDTPAFDFILLAEDNPAERGARALLRTGTEGEKRLAELMKGDE